MASGIYGAMLKLGIMTDTNGEGFKMILQLSPVSRLNWWKNGQSIDARREAMSGARKDNQKMMKCSLMGTAERNQIQLQGINVN